MNIKRMKKAIAVMTRAAEHDSIDMEYYQSHPLGIPFRIVYNEAELHLYGNKACFAGHIAVSPEFQEDGGGANHDGCPMFNSYQYASAISEWLDIDHGIAADLVYTGNIYQKPWKEVNGLDVVKVLQELLEHGEDKMSEKIKSLTPEINTEVTNPIVESSD